MPFSTTPRSGLTWTEKRRDWLMKRIRLLSKTGVPLTRAVNGLGGTPSLCVHGPVLHDPVEDAVVALLRDLPRPLRQPLLRRAVGAARLARGQERSGGADERAPTDVVVVDEEAPAT